MVIMQTGSELLFNVYLNCHYEKMIGYKQLPQDASDAQGGVNQIESLLLWDTGTCERPLS